MKKTIGAIVVLVILLIAGIIYLDGAMPIGAGYTSKYLCSQLYLSGRDPAFVFEHDVKPTNPLFHLFSYSVNRKNKTVTAAGFGFWHPKTAVYREGFGCTLAIDVSREELLKEAEGAIPQTKADIDKPWPAGEKVDLTDLPPEIDSERLNRALEDAFTEPGSQSQRNTQAVVIVYKGRIVAEKYQEQFTPSTPMLGWSMSKSVTSALVGILVREGKLDIYDPAPIKAWKNPDDPRSAITLDQLLRMSSSLEFEEEYKPYTDVVYMLYDNKNMADYAIAKPLVAKPDEVWSYSSGSANIVASIVKAQVGNTLVSFNNFARQELFDKIQMHSAIIEPDASGSFVGSSYMFATARDWARIGLLYLNDGVWGDERILPEGWVTYSTTPTPKAPKGEYGAQIWLNAGEKGNPQNREYPSLPADMFFFEGFNQRIVAILPSQNLVVVRLGTTHKKEDWDLEVFVRGVMDSIRTDG